MANVLRQAAYKNEKEVIIPIAMIRTTSASSFGLALDDNHIIPLSEILE